MHFFRITFVALNIRVKSNVLKALTFLLDICKVYSVSHYVVLKLVLLVAVLFISQFGFIFDRAQFDFF